jgi:hypothetical protein
VHLSQFLHGGVLWRDEAGSVTLATLPDVSNMWSHLYLESFPVGWSVILRLWQSLGLAGSDTGLRGLGLLIGLGLLAALWHNARCFGYAAPTFSLALLALNPSVIHWGDALREFGLGMLVYLLGLAALWRANEAPTPRRFMIAVVLAVASIQCLFLNAIFLTAACLGAMAVDIRLGKWKRLTMPVGIGIAAVFSLLPYVLVFMAKREWDSLIRVPLPLTSYCSGFAVTLRSAGNLMEVAWWISLTGGALIAFRGLRRSLSEKNLASENSRILFAAVTILASGALFFALLSNLDYPTADWYFLGLIASCASGLDLLFCPLLASFRGKVFQSIFLLIALAASFPSAWKISLERYSNLDEAVTVVQPVSSEDFVVVEPWFLGISFSRLYDGPAPWTTLPPVDDHRFHRFDVIKEEMATIEPNAPVFDRMASVLSRGGRVWVVRLTPDMPPSQALLRLPPAPHSPSGWRFGPYMVAWATQLDAFLRARAQEVHEIPLPASSCNSAETARVLEVRGWRASR